MTDSSHRAKQKAIDGILFGDSPVPKSRRPLAPRLRTGRDNVPAASVGAKSPVRGSLVSTSSRSGQRATMTADMRIALDDLDDLAPKGRKKPSAAARGGFWRRKWGAVRQWSWKKKLLVGFLALLVLAVIAGGFLFLKGFFNAKKVFKGGGSAVSLQEEVKPELLKGEGDGRINILLLGIGGEGHEAPDLTDTIMVASIDPVNHKTALLSIPRDLWVSVPSKGSMKINAVYETGKYAYLGKQSFSNKDAKAVEAGYMAVDKTLEDILGVPIHYHVLLNFQAFQQAIDTVGGIDVDVPERLYDPTMAWQNGRNPVIAEKGVQHFDGRKALMYVRSRYTTSDFARAQRQRAVMVALQQKVFSLGTFGNPQKIGQLMDTFGDKVVTDLALKDVSRLYQITKEITPDKVQSVGLTDPPNSYVTTGAVGNQSVVLPRAGIGNYGEIRSYVRNTLRDGYLAKENAAVMVLNGTETPGLATQKADILKSYGYTVGAVGDAPTKNYADTVIVDLTKGKKPFTAQYLKKRLGVSKVKTSLPDTAIQPQNADFVIILGEDETTNSQN